MGAAIIAVCLLLMLIVLIQRGRGQGLSGAFGGGGGGGAFGAKTGDVFTWITVGLAALFLMLNVVGNFAFDMSPLRSTQASDTTTTLPVETPGPAETPGTTEAPAPSGEPESPITLQGKTDTGEPLEIKLDGPFDSADKAKEAAEGDKSAQPEADKPAGTDTPSDATKKPQSGGESGSGSGEG